MSTESIHIEGGALFAKVEDRTVSGLLLPWNQLSRKSTTSEPVSFARGTVKTPRDLRVMTANVEHNPFLTVASTTSLEDTEEGLVATFAVAESDEGDAFLAEVAEGRLSKLSAEFRSIVREGAKAISGVLTGASFVTEGAFESAAVFSIAAPETDAELAALDERIATAIERAFATYKTTAESEDTEESQEPEDPDTNQEKEEDIVAEATVPFAEDTTPAVAQLSKGQVFAALHAIKSGRGDAAMLARLGEAAGPSEDALFALDDIKLTTAGSVGVNITQPQWIGELWEGVTYKQTIAPLFNHADLTSFTINGFRWTTRPQGGTWAGDKANVPTNTPATSAFTTTAQRFAGGHDVAREFRDFNVEGFWESYFAAMAESYARWIDEDVVLTDIIAGATSVEADNPAGLTIGAGLSSIIDGATAVLAANAGTPSFALVAPALYKSILKTPQSDVLGYLNAALGLEEGSVAGFQIRSSSLLGTGEVLVGTRQAATVYELPGSPIRAEGLDLVRGGIDPTIFGYAATVIHKATALQLVTPYVA